MGRPRARPRLGRRPERAGRAARLGAAALRVPLVLRLGATSRATCSRAAPIPNATFLNEYGRMSALYGAAGRRARPRADARAARGGRRPRRRRVALPRDRGREPRVPARSCSTTARSTRGTNALAHALDDERDASTSGSCSRRAPIPNEGALVAHAVRRGRGPRVRAAARRARRRPRPARAARPGAATCRCGRPTSTPCCAAATTSARRARGARRRRPTSTRRGRRGGRGRARRAPAGPLPATLDPDAQEVLVLAALRGRLDAVVDAVGPGFAGVVGGSPEGTLLHHAAWVGDPDVVARCSPRGADPRAAAGPEHATPLAWAAHGSQYHELRAGLRRGRRGARRGGRRARSALRSTSPTAAARLARGAPALRRRAPRRRRGGSRPVAPHRPRSSSATAPSTKAAPTNAPAQSGSSSTVAPITAPTSGVT